MKIHPRSLLAVSLLALCVAQMATASVVYAAEEAAKEEKADKGGGEGGKGKSPEGVTGGRFAGDPIYVHITPMVLPVISDSGVEQLVTLVFDVQVKDFEAADTMHAHMPKVMDSLMRSLYGGLGRGTLRNGKLVNIVKVKDKASDAVGEIIGKDKVVNVLIQNVSQRML